MPAHTADALIQTAYKEVLKKQDRYERRIQLALRDALIKIQGEMKAMYDKWAVNGKLTYAETAKYNRYASMESNILSILDPVLKENIKEIKKLLPEQYNESFYRTAWAIDNASGLRLDWGPVNKNMVMELFSIDNVKNKEMAEALYNYTIEARKKIRQALMSGMTIGKSFDEMSKDLKKAINVISYKALMIARTEGMTAINHGTNDGYIKAKAKGIEGDVVWSATKDGRTRDTHGAMDGKIQQEDGLFDGPGGERTPFPGWEGLSAEERIHCRCNEQFQIKGYSPQLMRTRESGIVPYQNYEDWKANKDPGDLTKLKVKTPEELQIEFGNSLVRQKSLGGSTGAYLASDPEGNEWVVKQYLSTNNPADSVANEYVASQLYQKLGVLVPESKLAIINGKPAYVTRKLNGTELGSTSGAMSSSAIKASVQKGFVADAFLANWDSLGLSEDNILVVGGNEAYRIDLGGSLLFRAQGGMKSQTIFSGKISELETLRDPKINANAAKWFGTISDEEVYNQIQDIKQKLSYDDISDLVESSPLSAALKTRLKETLLERVKYLDDYGQQLSVKIVQDKAAQKAAKAVAKKKIALTGFAPASKGVDTVTLNHGGSHRQEEFTISKHIKRMHSSLSTALKKFTGPYYGVMNSYAIAGNPSVDLEAAIDKLPRVRNNLWRSVRSNPSLEQSIQKWISGEWEGMEWKAFSSTSFKRDVWSGDISFCIINDGTNLKAGLIGALSSNPSETEVIVNHGARFKVLGYAQQNGKYTFLLRPKNPLEPSGMSQGPIREYTMDEIKRIYDNDIKVWE